MPFGILIALEIPQRYVNRQTPRASASHSIPVSTNKISGINARIFQEREEQQRNGLKEADL
jgi:hypothetical protein